MSHNRPTIGSLHGRFLSGGLLYYDASLFIGKSVKQRSDVCPSDCPVFLQPSMWLLLLAVLLHGERAFQPFELKILMIFLREKNRQGQKRLSKSFLNRNCRSLSF